MNLNRYFSSAYTTRILILTFDVLFACFSYALAISLRINFKFEMVETSLLPQTLMVIAITRLISFKVFKTYSGIIRFTGEQDAMRVFMAVSASSAFLFILTFDFETFGNYFFFRKSILVIDYLLCLFILISYRFFMRIVYRHIRKERDVKLTENIVIIGAGQGGHLTKRALDSDSNTKMNVVAFFDDNPGLERQLLEGIPIFNIENSFKDVVQKRKISKAIIAIQKISQLRKQEIVDLCLSLDIMPMIVPPVEKWLHNNLNTNAIRKINIEDLLHRDPIKLDFSKISSELNNKVVLITGAAGSIGSEIVRQVLQFHPQKLLMLDQAESPLVDLHLEIQELETSETSIPLISDVRDLKKLTHIFELYKPDYVFHAAAYKHVPMMEYHPQEAIKTNVVGVKNMANLAVKYGVKKFVMISTDKAVNPTNVMGASKRIAELYCQSLNFFEKNPQTKFITTRFGNVLGSNGSVVPRFKKQIEAGGPITITHPDITRYFMTIPEACQLVLEAGAMGSGGEIYLFDMGQPIKIVDLAKKMVKLYGLEVGKNIHISFTGLRAGEKLYEELLNNSENTIKTNNPKIMVGVVQETVFEKVYEEINLLIKSLESGNDLKIVENMKMMVPEYISNASKYEVLDK
ncbi:polysaccharide biosynthesis protein [Flexithrix dorotheae]|uniref:polysaccharide biosynthesis protein n=1 Tax=Flexithrix dorotheae TaxID=70993 RepID=UPI000379CF37|nr:nucleoside-diphosphate sugar epimerase/dehydratase [Flexithrix dorotheae]